MEKVQLLVDLQLLVTIFLVTLLWSFSARLRKQEFFRLWAWAWTSFAAYLGMGAISFRVAPQWPVVKAVATLLIVEAGFLQVSLLVLGVLSLQTGERPPRQRLRIGRQPPPDAGSQPPWIGTPLRRWPKEARTTTGSLSFLRESPTRGQHKIDGGPLPVLVS